MGKTQLSMTLCILSYLAHCGDNDGMGGDGGVLFIDTETKFSAVRYFVRAVG